MKVPAGQTFSTEELTKALEQHKPAMLFLCQVGGWARALGAVGRGGGTLWMAAGRGQH